MFVSTDGRTFAEPPDDWKPVTGSSRGGNFSAGSQSLAGDLIRDGITGVSAHVAEPFLDATIRPQILFPAYLAGFNLVESFYLAMPYLSWQTMVIGDPLCSITSRPPLPPADLDAGMNRDVRLPAIFADRRLKLLTKPGLNREAIVLMVRAQSELAHDPKFDPEPLFVRATELDPKLVALHIYLAGAYEGRAEYDNAIERYRRVIAVEPQNAIALNNLAYSLATRKKAPVEALPFAERALRASATPAVLDTLGWIQHLLGDNQTAALHLERALSMTQTNAEILLHAAVVHGALKDFVRARRELDAAEKLDPKIKDQEEAKALRKLIGA
jgi:Flp pilus assembly protein TadD